MQCWFVACQLLGGVLEPRHEVKAATSGTWELVKTKANVQESVDGNAVKFDYSYEGIVDGSVRYKVSGGEIGSVYLGSGHASSCDQYYECTQPNESIAFGEEIKLTMHTYIENLFMEEDCAYYFAGSCSACVDYADLTEFYGSPHYSKFKDSDGETSLAPSTRSKQAFDESMTVTAKMPDNAKDGDKVSIYFEIYHQESGCAYEWQYQFHEGSSDDDATTIGEDTDDEDDIVVGQVKNVKVTNKKVKRIYISYGAVSGATGYQIQYSTKKSMSGAKSMNASVTKGYFKNSKGKKATFQLRKTYYVRVRAYAKDSSGSKVYGKWSAKKKVTIKK